MARVKLRKLGADPSEGEQLGEAIQNRAERWAAVDELPSMSEGPFKRQFDPRRVALLVLLTEEPSGTL